MLASKGRKENAMRSVKEYLEQVRKQADRVEDLKQDVQYLDDGMASIGSTSFCKTDGHSGSPQAGFVLLVERKDAKQQKLDLFVQEIRNVLGEDLKKVIVYGTSL